MIVSKLGVKVGNTVLSSLDKNEIELLNGAVGDLVVNTNDSANILVNIISHALSGVGLSEDLMQKLRLIERLSNSVGYGLDLVIEDVVTRKVNEIKFNGIYIRRVSDGEIVYFVPYEFYRSIAEIIYSADKTSFSADKAYFYEYLGKEFDDYETELREFFSKPEGSNIKTITIEDRYNISSLANFHYGEGFLFALLRGLGYGYSEVSEFIASYVNSYVRDYFLIWESFTNKDFTRDEEGDFVDDVFELIYV